MKAEISLETIAKAILVIAVIVILLIIFRKLMGNAGTEVSDLTDQGGDQASRCLDNPKECNWGNDPNTIDSGIG
jgi:hypothetical protein